METNTSPLPDGTPPSAAPPLLASSSTPPSSPEARGPNFFERTWPKVKPYVDRSWLVLRAWVPFFANPEFRSKQVIYVAKDSRNAGVWTVALPKKCLHCGRDEVTVARQFPHDVRNFETPAPILGAIAGLFVFFMLLWLWLSYSQLFLLSLAILLGGAVLMYVKSWKEEVEIAAWACADHTGTAVGPEIVPQEDVLHVIVANTKLAEAARADVLALRKARQGYAGAPPSTSSASPPPARPTVRPGEVSPATPPRPETASYRREELPPIKLDE
jgi:hypothetical protein